MEVDCGKVLTADHPGNDIRGLKILVWDNQGPGLFGVLGVLDVNRYITLDGRDEGLIMESLRMITPAFPGRSS